MKLSAVPDRERGLPRQSDQVEMLVIVTPFPFWNLSSGVGGSNDFEVEQVTPLIRLPGTVYQVHMNIPGTGTWYLVVRLDPPRVVGTENYYIILRCLCVLQRSWNFTFTVVSQTKDHLSDSRSTQPSVLPKCRRPNALLSNRQKRKIGRRGGQETAKSSQTE